MRQSGRNASMIEPNSQSRIGSGQAVSRRKGMVALRDYAGAWRHAPGPIPTFAKLEVAAKQPGLPAVRRACEILAAAALDNSEVVGICFIPILTKWYRRRRRTCLKNQLTSRSERRLKAVTHTAQHPVRQVLRKLLPHEQVYVD